MVRDIAKNPGRNYETLEREDFYLTIYIYLYRSFLRLKFFITIYRLSRSSILMVFYFSSLEIQFDEENNFSSIELLSPGMSSPRSGISVASATLLYNTPVGRNLYADSALAKKPGGE